MATTSVYGLPYQALTDPPHGPNLGQDLAEAVEAELSRIDSETRPRGHLASPKRTTNVSATTIEMLADSATFTCVAGKRHKITWDGLYASTAAGENGELRLRYAAGASVTNTNTNFKSKLVQPPVANTSLPVSWVTTIPPGTLPAGQVTVGIFLVRTFGSGTHSVAATTTGYTELIVEDIGT